MYPTFKTKDLINLPFFVAEALRADGWYLRSAMPWLKTNPMPESCEDRPGSAVEYVFLLSKSKSYYYDRVAVMRPMKQIKSLGRNFRNTDLFLDSLQYPYGLIADAEGDPLALHISTLPLREAHFATFPPALIEPCILAGCPAQCCAKCGAPWERETERTAMVIDRSERTHDLGHTRSSGTMLKPATTTTTGWAPSCSCHADTSPGLVLDPFAGAGTTGLVATRLGRNSLMIELNPEYVEIAKRRIENDQLNQAYKKTSKAMNGQHAG